MEIPDFGQLYREQKKKTNPDLVRKFSLCHNMKKQFYVSLNHTHVKLNGKSLGALGPEVVIYMADS